VRDIIKLLIKIFIKDSDNITNSNVRQKYGILGGAVGIFLNLFLFVGKFFAGIVTSSIAITADAFNNLSDAGSSIISLVGFKMAVKPADNEHPFGHGRFEYISAFAISMIIILMGFELAKSSVGKIIHPVDVKFSGISNAILVASILIKLWMCYFNTKLGQLINSAAMKATAKDSISDAVATSAVLAGVILTHFIGVNIDGYLGVLVAIFILYTGYTTSKETLSHLLGEAPDKEFIEEIRHTVLVHDEVVGIHDIIVHNYGAGQCIVSLHAEVPCEMDILVIHDVIDLIEIELKNKFSCSAVIHMDPIAMNDEETLKVAQKIVSILKSIDTQISMHDFRMVNGETHTNLIFDVAIPFNFKLSDGELLKIIKTKIAGINSCYNAVIKIDKEPM